MKWVDNNISYSVHNVYGERGGGGWGKKKFFLNPRKIEEQWPEYK